MTPKFDPVLWNQRDKLDLSLVVSTLKGPRILQKTRILQ